MSEKSERWKTSGSTTERSVCKKVQRTSLRQVLESAVGGGGRVSTKEGVCCVIFALGLVEKCGQLNEMLHLAY